MTTRSFPKGEIFHICNKSISNYQIFRKERWIFRFLTTINYYNFIQVDKCLSKAIREPLDLPDIMINNHRRIFSLLAYCIMPDHYHLLVKLQSEYSFSKYMNNIENSYSRYFNTFNRRKGPLWQSQFRAVIVEDNETLLHIHRYIHLNPTTSGFVEKPEEWEWSSYKYFITEKRGLAEHKEISINSIGRYKRFVENQIDYQKTIKGIRRSLLE